MLTILQNGDIRISEQDFSRDISADQIEAHIPMLDELLDDAEFNQVMAHIETLRGEADAG